MTGQKVILRSPEPYDVEYIYNLENNPEIWHLGDTFFPFSKFDIENYVLSIPKDIFKNRQLRLMIDRKDDKKTIGTVDLFDFQPYNRRVAIGIIIEPEYRRQGFAKDVLDVIVSYCFKILNLHQIYAGILENNIASINLFESRNFTCSGKQKDWLHLNGRWVDLYLYQLINPDEVQDK